jgi:hypothetical protein
MKLRNAIVGLALVLAAGCDTMDQDADGQILSINDSPAYLLADTDGIIDLPSRIVYPGKVKVEITGSTSNGVLQDMGAGLLRYSPSKGSKNDSFRFKVFSADDKVLGEHDIDIIVGDTTSVPCAVYTRNDSIRNVTGPITVDVSANDWACGSELFVSISTGPENGTATVIGKYIKYTPGATFDGRDQVLYLAETGTHKGYGLLVILSDSTVNDSIPSCMKLRDDLFYKPLNDTSVIYLDILANDTLCGDSLVQISGAPKSGYAFYDWSRKKIGYKNFPTSNADDSLQYFISKSNRARVVIKRR